MQTFLILLFISPIFYGFQLTSFLGYGVTALDIVMALFYLYILKKIIWDGIELKFSITPPLIFLLIFLATVLLSGISPVLEGQGTWIIQYFKSLSHLLFIVLFTLICSVYPIDFEKWTKTIISLLIISLIINIFGIYQIIARAYDLPLAWITLTNISLNRGEVEGSQQGYKQLSLAYGNFFRATSIFTEPSALGSFNAHIISFLLIPLVFNFKRFINNKTFWVILLIFCSAASLFTFSMTAFVGFLLVAFGFIVTQKFKNLIRFFTIVISIVVVVFVADLIFSKTLDISVVDLFSQRIEGIATFGSGQKEVYGESFGVRVSGVVKAIEVWKHYPITGIGLGLSAYNKINDLTFADMSFFGVLAELGILGSLAYLLLFISLLYLSFKLIKDKSYFEKFENSERRILIIPFFLMLLQVLINFISGNNYIGFNSWSYIGLSMAVINQAYYRNNIRRVNFRLVKTPLKIRLAELLSSDDKGTSVS